MIIKGKSNCCADFWAKHLTNTKENDRADLKEIRGLASENLKDALWELEEDAKYTRCTNYFYQAIFSPPIGTRLTEEEWDRTFEIFEKQRGIPEGQSRVVYEHEKKGHVHRHVIWGRIDSESGRAWGDSNDAAVCAAASKAICEELHLTRSASPFDKDREGPSPERNPKSWEMFRGLKSGMDPRDIRAEVTSIFRESHNGADFMMGLEQHGYQLVRGDRRDYCIIDPAGEVHSLARRLEGVTAKHVRWFMSGLQRDAVPTIDQVKEQQQARDLEDRAEDLASVQKEIAWEEQLARAAIRKEKRDPQFVELESDKTKERDGKETISAPPPWDSERTTSPRHHFDDANREATDPDKLPTMPENLRGYAALIWDAYNLRTWERKKDDTEIKVRQRDPEEFKQALEQEGVLLASVSKEEATRSHMDAAFAHAVRGFAPEYRAGEIVAVTEQGYVFKLGNRTTGKEPWEVQRFLAPIDKSELKSIGATKEIQADRSERNIQEVQAFRDMLRDAKIAERFERATKVRGKGKKRVFPRGVVRPVLETASAGISTTKGILSVGDTLVDGITNLFAPTLTPVQQAESKLGKAEREFEAQHRRDHTLREKDLDRER